MKRTLVLTLILLTSSNMSQAMRPNLKDDKGEKSKSVAVKAYDPRMKEAQIDGGLIITQTTVDLNECFKTMVKKSRTIMDISGGDLFTNKNNRLAKEILEHFKTYNEILPRFERQLNYGGFTPSYLRQLNSAIALAAFVLANEDSQYYGTCLDHCRKYLHYSKDEVLEEKKPDEVFIKVFFADSVMETIGWQTRENTDKFVDLLRSAEYYEEANKTVSAYNAYNNAFQILRIEDRIPGKAQRVSFVRSKLKILWDQLKQEANPDIATIKAARSINRSAETKADTHRNFRQVLKDQRSNFKDQAESYKKMAKNFVKQGDQTQAVSADFQASLSFLNARLFSRFQFTSQELCEGAIEALKLFENGASELLNMEGDKLYTVYKHYFDSKHNICLNPEVTTDLRRFIFAFLHMGEFHEAQVRCDVLCRLETEKLGFLSEETNNLRIKVKAFNGDFEELIQLEKEREVAAEAEAKKKEAKKLKKKERDARNRQDKLAQQNKQEEEKIAKLIEEQPGQKAPAAVKKSDTNDLSRDPFLSTTYFGQGEVPKKGDIPEVREKEKTRGTPHPPAVIEEVLEEDNTPEPIVKVLSHKDFNMCKTLLTDTPGSRNFKRSAIFTFLEHVGLTVHRDEGKGSHTKIKGNGEIISNFILRKKGKTVGVVCEIDQDESNPYDDNQIPNVVQTAPKEWDKMPYYMIRAIRSTLERIGYTPETIKMEETKETTSKPQPKAKVVSAKKKQSGPRRKK